MGGRPGWRRRIVVAPDRTQIDRLAARFQPIIPATLGFYTELVEIVIFSRADIVPWSLLTDVKVRFQKPRMITTFPEAVRKLDRTTVKVQGFMAPLEPGTSHKRFLLVSVPPTCAFCMPGGAESMVEVRTLKPVKYTLNALVVQGQFQDLEDDPQGLYYRMTGARDVP